MTHNELFNLVMAFKDSLPDHDKDGVVMLAQSALGQFKHMQMGQEHLFHSSWEELCSCVDSCIHGWIRGKLSGLLSPDSPYFEPCLSALLSALESGYPCWEFRSQCTGLPHSIHIDFPLVFRTYRKEL